MPQSQPPPQHPLFEIYTREHISHVTGYSKVYLSRVSCGRTPLTRAFIDRVCFKLECTEEQLFSPDAVVESKAD